MTGAFTFAVDPEGRRLVARHQGLVVATFDFALPPAEAGPVRAALAHREDGDGWLTTLRIDNTGELPVALPPVGVGVSVGAGWSGWAWASDPEGFVLIAPDAFAAPTLVVRGRGFLRAVATVPVFTPAERRDDPALPAAWGALHLAHPTGSLRAFGRTQTALEFGVLGAPDDAAQYLPDWLPTLVVEADDEVAFETPDQAVVAGAGAEITTLDTTAVLRGGPGHREVAVHTLRGVHRLRSSFAPSLSDLLGDIVATAVTRRPSSVATATGALVAVALELSATGDAERALDWLEREDWLARGDLIGCAVAAAVAVRGADAALARDAWRAVAEAPLRRGRALVGLRCWLARATVAGEVCDLAEVLGGGDGLAEVEAALVGQAGPHGRAPALTGVLNRLGGELPGQPLRLAEAEAGYLVALLRLVPESWPQRALASRVAEKASGLLRADHAEGLHPAHEGLAWLALAEGLAGGR